MNDRSYIIFVLLFVSMLLMIPGAGSTGDSKLTRLRASKWEWVRLMDPVHTTQITKPENYAIAFSSDGRAVITADCNVAQASYEAGEDGSLKITIGPMTRAACPESLSDEFVTKLGYVANYFFKEGGLFMDMMADGGTFEFRPATAESSDAGPSFDCAAATGQVEQLICKDESLATLDREMARVFAGAKKEWPAEEVAKQQAKQRVWIKGRDDCGAASDPRACVEDEYKTRIAEIQITSGQLMAPTAVSYTCEGGEGELLWASFYNVTDPKSVVLTVGNEQAIAFRTESGSGAKYSARDVDFWEHQGEAMVTWFSKKLSCQVLR